MADITALLATVPGYSKTIEINGLPVDVRPVSITEIAEILAAHPQALDAFDGGDKAALVQTLLSVGPKFAVAVLAAGTGHHGEQAVIDGIAKLPSKAQAQLLAEIVKITMPEGIEGFLSDLAPVLSLVAAAE